MKVILPEHVGDIKLYQFQDYEALRKRELEDIEFNKRKICCFTELKYHDLKDVRYSDFEGLLAQIDTALNTEYPFVQRFELNGIEFGLIPNLDKITQGEYVDLGNDEIENYHTFMSIMFRPIVKEDKYSNYEIEPYTASEKHIGLMKQVPLSIVIGARVFFCNLGKDLETSFQRYIIQTETQKDKQQKTTLKNGVGSQH